MLNDSWAGRNPTRVVVPIEEEEDYILCSDETKMAYKNTDDFNVMELYIYIYIYTHIGKRKAVPLQPWSGP
jgi:hypothetical protein